MSILGDATLTEAQPMVKIIVRTIARGMPMDGSVSSAEVEAYLAAYIEAGYNLASVHYVGEQPEGFIFAYHLVKPL